MSESARQIASLLEETQHAHHQAYLATDGYDPDWPIWYAGYLEDKLPPLLGVDLTKSEITYWMVLLNNQQQEASTDNWAQFYAQKLIDGYQ
jgi:hypothetical protein